MDTMKTMMGIRSRSVASRWMDLRALQPMSRPSTTTLSMRRSRRMTPFADTFMALISEGLDENDAEAMEYAGRGHADRRRGLLPFTNELFKLDILVLAGRKAMARTRAR